MLTTGIDHVALTTTDLAEFTEFCVSHFDAIAERTVALDESSSMGVIQIGPHTEFNVFETTDEADPALLRGRLDHFGLRAVDLKAFDEIRVRLIESGASDGYVSDFGPNFSMFFRAPDGLEGELLVANPSPEFAHYGPGRQAARYAD